MVTVTETCSKLYSIECIVVFWLSGILVSTATQRDGAYQKIKANFARYVFALVYTDTGMKYTEDVWESWKGYSELDDCDWQADTRN
jgi:hypothetical protein